MAFSVDRVLLSCPYETVSVLTRTRRMIPDLNRIHGPDVRALAAFSAGRPVRDVIGAELNHLCPLGFGLRWVSAEGGDNVRYRFDEPACDPVEIRRRLQGYVGAATP